MEKYETAGISEAKLEFRPYDIVSDYAFLYAAHRETSEITFGVPFDDDKIKAQLNRSYTLRRGAYLDGRLVGICDLDIRETPLSGAFCNFSFLYVAKDFRNKGLAGQIIGYASQWCADRGLTKLILKTGRNNFPAQRCYEKNGFVRYPQRDDEYETGYLLHTDNVEFSE